MAIAIPSDGALGLPLASIDAVVFDTETTGLDPLKARVVEIAGIRVSAGKIEPEDYLSVLVDPEIPIPESATRIHGITDADVAGADKFVEGFEKFSSWVGARFYVGYAVSFDLSILETEFARHDLVWAEPRTLDIEELVQLLAPDLPNLGLDTVASWLGVPMEGRHRALSDAQVTAEIFVKLLPRLRANDVVSYAAADRLCKSRRRRRGSIIRIDEPVRSELMSVDNFVYHNRIQDVMSNRPIMVRPDSTLKSALAKMSNKRIGSVFVMETGDLAAGIMTESDVLRAINSDGVTALSRTVSDYCSRPLVTVAPKEFVYRAIVQMSTRKMRHLGVIDDAGDLIGAISARDIFGSYSDDAISLGREIESASDSAELGRIWIGLTTVVRSLLESGVEAHDITAIVSRELRALTQQACVIAEQEIKPVEGKLFSPRYAMLVLGSGGRGESLLAMDQDNAIIFAEGRKGGLQDSWLAQLGARVADILHESGVRYCDGGIMASNPEWRMDLDRWWKTVNRWIASTTPDDLLHADIFFDSMPVHGDSRLANRFRRETVEAASQSRPFLNLLSLRASQFTKPSRWLGRWKLQSGRMDLKKQGIMPIFSAARAAALAHGVLSRSTSERLRFLKDSGYASVRTADDLISAHRILMGLILRQQLRDIGNGLPPTNWVAPNELDNFERQQLSWALSRLNSISNLLGTPPSI